MASRAEPFPFETGVQDLIATYRAAQREIAAQVIAAIKTGNLQRAAQRRAQLATLLNLLDQIGAQTDPIAQRLVAEAHAQGAAATVTHLGAATAGPEIPGSFAGISREAVTALHDAMLGRLKDSRVTVGRAAGDAYAKAGRRAALRAVLGAEGSPRLAARQLAQDLKRDKDIARLVHDSRGAVGFVDKAGKRWSMDTYSEMVVRTTTREAVVQGQVDRMVSHGVNLARVSSHASSCPICTPLEGKLVSLDGRVTDYYGEPVGDSSRLPPFHPNCRHTIYPVSSSVEETRRRIEAQDQVGRPLDNVGRAYVAPAKLRDYALNPAHPSGGPKARVFRSALGYTQADWPKLREAITDALPGAPVTAYRASYRGFYNFEVIVQITGLNGKTHPVSTAWHVGADGRPSLASARVLV